MKIFFLFRSLLMIILLVINFSNFSMALEKSVGARVEVLPPLSEQTNIELEQTKTLGVIYEAGELMSKSLGESNFFLVILFIALIILIIFLISLSIILLKKNFFKIKKIKNPRAKANEVFFKPPKRKSALKGEVLDLFGAIKKGKNKK